MLDVEEVLVHVKVVVPVEIRGLHTSRFDDDMIADGQFLFDMMLRE